MCGPCVPWVSLTPWVSLATRFLPADALPLPEKTPLPDGHELRHTMSPSPVASVCDLDAVYKKTPERERGVASGSQHGTLLELLWLPLIKEVVQRGTKWFKQTGHLERAAPEMRLLYRSQARAQL